MTLVNIDNNLINMDAVAVVEDTGHGIRIRYIGGYQTRIDCVDYETFTKWAKEKVSEENSYQKCYEKGLNDAKRKQTPVRVCCDKEIRNETIERILEIIDREKNQWQNLTSQEEVILFQAYKDLQTAVKELRGG